MFARLELLPHCCYNYFITNFEQLLYHSLEDFFYRLLKLYPSLLSYSVKIKTTPRLQNLIFPLIQATITSS